MAKTASSTWVVSLTTLLLLGYGICESEENDFSLGCFKQNTSETHFNITAGDYVYSVNLTGKICAKACSNLNISVTFAAVSVNGICLCSQNKKISMPSVSNSSCLYPQSDGLYYRVYSVAVLPMLNAPSSVATLKEFNVSITFPGDPSCSYTLDFDDGIKKIISQNDTTVSHYYASAGEYRLELSSSPQCMPQAVKATVTATYEGFANASLDCPDVVELTEKASCMLSVLAAGTNVNISNSTNATLADTVVETIGPKILQESDTVSVLSNGTYVMPLSSAINDGSLVGFQMDLLTSEDITVQILSPVCSSGQKPCRGGCVSTSDSCTGEKTSYGEILSFCSSATNVSTESNHFTTYRVSSEFVFKSTGSPGSKLMNSPSPVSIKRGDVLAFHISTAARIPHIKTNSSYVLTYCGQKFSKGQTINVSDANPQQNVVIWFRMHLRSSVSLEIPIKLKLPSVHYVYNVSSASSLAYEIVRATVLVQERISGLKILSPRIGKYYATGVDILFEFNVTNGTSVEYTVKPADGTADLNTTANQLNHVYRNPGNYTFNVTASNRINSVNASQTVSIAEDIKNLTFIRDPKLHPGEVGKPYQISFSLQAGDNPTFYVEYGNNVSMFYSCDDDFNKTITTNITYTEVGTYNITVSAFGLVEDSKLTIRSTVEIMSPIQNFSVNIATDELNVEVKNASYSIEKHDAGKSIYFQANIGSGSPVSFVFIIIQPEPKGKLTHNEWDDKPLDNTTKIVPKALGLWKVIVVAKNGISNRNCTISINVQSLCVPQVQIYDSRTRDRPFRTSLGSDIRVNSKIVWYNESCSYKISCLYNWTLYSNPNNSVSKQNKTFFSVKGGKLAPGTYRLELVAVCNGTRQYNKSFDKSYLKLEASKPVAVIRGGLERDVVLPTDGIISLDASESYDPDVKNFNSTGLSFSWECSFNCPNVTFERRNSSVVRINATRLPTKTSFKMMVTVTTKFNNANANQTITIAHPNAPTTEIRCRINCLKLVNPDDRLSLEGHCLSCNHSKGNGSVTFLWTMYRSGANISVDTTTGFSKENIVLSPGVLNRSEKYELHLTTKRNNLQSRSVYSFETAGELTGGTCHISPKSGTAASDKFDISCSKWKAEKAPLVYDIQYKTSVETDTNLNTVKSKQYEWILWYHGQEGKTPARKLPAGPEKNGYKIEIIIEIRDGFGNFAEKNLTVEVKKLELDRDKLHKDIKKLESIDGAENPQELTQSVTLFAQVLNDGQNSSKDSEDTSKTSDKELRHTLAEKLSKVEANTLPLIQQTSTAVKLIASEKTQVVQKTQVSAVTTLEKMSESLLKIAFDPGRRTGQEIDKTSGSILSSLSKIMDASVFTGQDTSKKDAPELAKKNLYGTLSKKGQELEKVGVSTEDVIEVWDKTFEKVTAAMSKGKLIGEEPTTINTSNFVVELNKVDDKRLNDGKIKESVSSETGSKAGISLPSLSTLGLLKENKEGQIFTEMVYFNQNPYTWDIKTSHYIQPRVFTFNFRDENGKKITVKDLKVDINITLSNDGSGVVYTPLNQSKTDEKFFWYGFSVNEDHFDELMMLKIKKTGQDQKKRRPTFYVKFGEKVSRTNYDYKHPLKGDCVGCSGHRIDIEEHADDTFVVFFRDKAKLKSVKGVVSVGLLVCSHSDGQNCNPEDQVYDVFVQSISCRYWNHTEWLKDGCKVGRKSTPLNTVCQCNHLTAFSSYIVRPNPMTKFSLEDFEQGYVCFVAVAIMFIFYIIVLIWARRADRSDCAKVGVCALSDNGAQDRYRYEIAIWTGMRRNAGTGSEVTIILSGEKNDSEARSLVNPQNPRFVRGSMEKFLLTSPKEIGSLYCIRVWHDNSKGSWYLSRVMVTDLQKDERYYFICDRWLAVDEDDGQVERLLPVASDEELADFHHLFYTKTKRGLSDTHLWISVLNRPPQSTFTRVQRLSCCLCIVMATMCANAMFYQAESEPTASSTNFIGSYSFTWQEVYIGVISSLIIVPVNVVILHIFRNARPRAARKSQRQSNSLLPRSSYDNIRTSQTSLETLEGAPGRPSRDSTAVDTRDIYSRLSSAELKKKQKEKLSRWERFKKCIFPSSLPHWFVYVGWVILVLTTLGSAAVVILYGMQFGNGRSLQWLFSIVVSICEDIFVLQPLKVLVFALGFALIIKKPDEGEFGMSEYYEDDDDSTSQQGNVSEAGNDTEKKVSTPRLPVRPTDEMLAVMRKARVKERKMFFLIQEIIVHLIFTIIIGLVTYGHKDTRSVYMYRHMDRLSAMTDKLDNFSHFWNWSRQVLIPSALPEKLYNGRYVQRYGFMDDGVNNLISKARMRVLRVKNESCKIPEQMKAALDFSLKGYSIFNEDKKCYASRWKTNLKGEKDPPWCFQDWRDLDGYPTWGRFNTYSGSGYISELIPGKDNNKTANELEALQWLNRQTRALFVELTTYNANINLYTAVSLLFEFPEFGGISYFKSIMPMRLKVYVGGFAFFIFACEMIFALFILGYTYIAVKKIYHQGMGYFKEFWNALDFAILLSSYAAIGVYVYRIDITTKLMQRVKDRDGEFVNFQYVSYWNEVLNCIMALVVALTTVKLTKLMRFNLRISLFGKTLQHAKPALIGFSFQFGIVFFAFIMFGVLVFGYNVSQFKTIPSAMMALGRVILGKSQFTELFLADRVIGPMFFFTYVMFVCWILVTMFVAILTDSYHEVQDRCFGMSNDYEIVDFVLSRLRSWAGFGKKKKLIPAEQRWRNAKIKAKAAATLGRQQLYKQSAEDIAYEKTGDLMEKLEDSIRSIEKRVNHLAVRFELETLD